MSGFYHDGSRHGGEEAYDMCSVVGIFWLSTLAIVYTYVGYPLFIGILAGIFPMPLRKEKITPKVSLIICAYNEEFVMREKIENSLALDYPKDRLEIIVASDCSTDRTDQIVSENAGRGVRLLTLTERKGKTAAQNLAVTRAEGEVIVFSDASILLEPDSIRNLVRNFSDPAVGCVSCEDKTVSIMDGKAVEDEGLYVKYEMLLRRWESSFGSLVGASGCFYGLRKSLWRHPEDFLVVDFTTALDVREQGYRTVSEPEAIAYVKTLASPEKEFARRVRTATRGLVGLLHKRQLLNPFRFGFFSFQLFSHKLLRFLAPFLLGLLLLANLALVAGGVLYVGVLALQVAFYASACVGFFLKEKPDVPRAFSFPLYFVMVNWAILVAWVRVVQGKTDATWAPTRRVPA
jgi:cellulose synthase/poly-beta-1,6-N-acetylglucosamine synthase-like glycosyltransferase